jgi:peptide/nickel transport system permease protein
MARTGFLPANAGFMTYIRRKNKGRAGASFLQNRVAVIAGVLIALIVLAAILAPLLSPYDPNAQDLSKSLQKASTTHLLGTDKQGRDLLSRTLYGARTTLLGALLIVAISALIGIPLGLISGYFGGKLDSLINRIWDVLLAFPALLLAFVFVAAFGRGLQNTVIALGIVYTPALSRLTRSIALVEKEQTYVEAARAVGFSNTRIIFRHVFPNCVSTILAQVTIDLAYAILDLASMSFLGLGVQPPFADWGSMLADGREYLLLSPAQAFIPGLAIIITVISFNLFGDGLQAYFDPRQRKLQEN